MTASRAISFAATIALSTGIAAATSTPAPYASSVNALQHRMQIMLKDVAHKNEQTVVTLQPDQSGLHTIVRITVRSQSELSKNINEYIDIHKGDCRPNTVANRTNVIPLNPIANGVSTTIVSAPLSTLVGHGNVITTRTPGGTVVDCGSL